MTLFGALAFLSPLLLLALLALPILWWLLRAVPPAPVRRLFPAVRIMLGLEDPEKTPHKTPWWLLLLRLLAIAAAILAFARPVLNPDVRETGSGPLLVLMDGGWASAPDWRKRQIWLETALNGADRDGRPVALIPMTQSVPTEGELTFQTASAAQERLALMEPQAYAPDREGYANWLMSQDLDGFQTIWLHDGLSHTGTSALVDVLQGQGDVTMMGGSGPPAALRPAVLEDGELSITAIRTSGLSRPVTVNVIGPDPAGIERVLASTDGFFEEDATETELILNLPIELRNRVTRFEFAQGVSAGGVVLADDGLRRRKVGLIEAGGEDEGQQLVRPLHYLRKALLPTAELIEAPLTDVLNTAPDMIVLADVGTLAPAEQSALIEWVEDGGLLLRFAGPRLAQSGIGQRDEDPLLPVRLRAGGRSVGGAMSWGAPKRLRPFQEQSPFFGLPLPGDVNVTSQVMAQPDPDLPNRVMAALEDGTPLVTGQTKGLGRVVLFHVTANAEWSSVPLSGLFVQMLERIALLSGATIGDGADLEGTQWNAEKILDGRGQLIDPPVMPGVDGLTLALERRDASSPPGLYVSGERRAAINLMTKDSTLTELEPPSGVTWAEMGVSNERDLAPPLLALAIILLAIDVLATLWISGRLRGGGAIAALVAAMFMAQPVDAQDVSALEAANNTVLAYVETGDTALDEISRAGLSGLSQVLNNRTAIEPIAPVPLNLETDELAFYPFIYWPISELQQLPSDEAYAKLNNFLRSGGMILFDTRDAHLGGGGFGTPNGRVLQRIAGKLDIPPLEPIPPDHVLTRTFYLLQAFPGRWASQNIWVEAAPEAEEVEGMPFRNLNDGVTPVVIGGNDWASAWALNDNGQFRFPVGSGSAGQRQREIAFRFGVNLIMHVMTGNYKSDQVHVPALLERLGQ